MANEKNMPLAGMKVVELGTHVAIPNVGRAMADCGAVVTKIENLTGEEWRMLGRLYQTPTNKDENIVFTNQNANKEFLALDLKKPEAVKILKQLLSEADVFITNVRLKGLEKMKLDYESLKNEFPKLIYCHFTGFGYDGPDSERPGFDMAAFWARTGGMNEWVNDGDFPTKPISGFGDACTSSIILAGVLMAIIARGKTGKGTLVSSSLYGSGIWHNAAGIGITQEPYVKFNPFPKSRYKPANPTSHIYQCKDGNWIIITVVNFDAGREKMLRILNMQEHANNPNFASLAELKKGNNMETFVKILNEKFLAKTRDEWAEIFQKEDIVYEKLFHYREISSDPQANINNYLSEVTFNTGTKVKLPNYPLLFSEYSLKNVSAAGGIGADTPAILKRLGYSEADIKKLLDAKAVGQE